MKQKQCQKCGEQLKEFIGSSLDITDVKMVMHTNGNAAWMKCRDKRIKK